MKAKNEVCSLIDKVGWAHKIILLNHHVNATGGNSDQSNSSLITNQMTETLAIDLWSLYKATANSQGQQKLTNKSCKCRKVE